MPSVTSVTLDSFRPETLDAAVTAGAVDHIQLGPGRFVGQLLHAELGGCVLDYLGRFSKSYATLYGELPSTTLLS